MGESGSGVWNLARARKANRRWMWVGVGLSLVAVLILSATFWLPYAWTYVMWSAQRANAVTVEYDATAAGAEHADVVAQLGPVSYEMPGFSQEGHVIAAVCVWQNTDAGEVRGMFIDGRLVGSLLVFE